MIFGSLTHLKSIFLQVRTQDLKKMFVIKRWKSSAHYILERDTLNNSENSNMKPESTIPNSESPISFSFFANILKQLFKFFKAD